MTKLYKRECGRCHGNGHLYQHIGVFHGVCFKCNGKGYVAVKTHPDILDARKAKADARRANQRELNRQAYIRRNFWRNIAKGIRKAVWEAERQAEHDAAESISAGKQLITGTIISTKLVDGFGYNQRVLKMVVKDDRGFKLYGTVPQVIIDEAVKRPHSLGAQAWDYEVLKGQRVTFSATVQASDDDDKFGFFKRPTKAAIAA